MKILALGASNSKASINKRLATFVAKRIPMAESTILDLNDFVMPLYGIDLENAEGIPEKAHQFKSYLKTSDKVIISFAEHNGSYTVAFKNVMDWISRIEGDTWESKTFFLLSTSPGGRGGQTVLQSAAKSFGHMGGQIAATFSLPHFHKNFNDRDGIINNELKDDFETQLSKFIKAS